MKHVNLGNHMDHLCNCVLFKHGNLGNHMEHIYDLGDMEPQEQLDLQVYYKRCSSQLTKMLFISIGQNGVPT